MKWLIAVVVVVIGAVLLFMYNRSGNATPTSTPTQIVTQSASPSATASVSASVSPSTSKTASPKASATPSKVTITYTDAGYSPKSVSVTSGTTVTFVNNSTRTMWTASGVHPIHSAYNGTSLSEHCPDTTGTVFDECQAVSSGTSWSFTFTKVGTWGYHNHARSSDTGTVIVK